MIRILSKNILDEKKEYNWKIKILKTKSKHIMIGIAQIIPEIINKEFVVSCKSLENHNSFLKKRSLMFYLIKKFDINIILNYGWYFNISNLSLYSDYPQNYRAKPITINNIQDEIKINVNMNEGTFNLILDNNYKIQIYNNIPLDKPISPSVLLYDEEDSIELIPL